MFSYDSQKFFTAQEWLNSAVRHLDSVEGNLSLLETVPSNFQKKAMVSDVVSDIEDLISGVAEIQDDVLSALRNICDTDATFSLAYNKIVINNYQNADSLNENESSILAFSNAEYYETLFEVLHENKDNLTLEQQAIYDELLEIENSSELGISETMYNSSIQTIMLNESMKAFEEGNLDKYVVDIINMYNTNPELVNEDAYKQAVTMKDSADKLGITVNEYNEYQIDLKKCYEEIENARDDAEKYEAYYNYFALVDKYEEVPKENQEFYSFLKGIKSKADAQNSSMVFYYRDYQYEYNKDMQKYQAAIEERDAHWEIFNYDNEKSAEKTIREIEDKYGLEHNADGFEVAVDYIITAPMSLVEGFVDVGEGLVDGIVYGLGKGGELFGIDDKWAQDFITFDASAEMYGAVVEAAGVDPDIAYGKVHSVCNFVGEMGGYYLLSCVPYVGPALSAVAGFGKGVEESMITQLEETGEINDWKVLAYGGLGALEGYGLGKAGKGIKLGIDALKQMGLSGLKEAAGNFTVKNIFNTITKGSGKIFKAAAINTLTEADTYVDVVSVIADDVIKGIDTGEWDVERILTETGVSFAGSFGGNLFFEFGGDVIRGKPPKTVDMDASDMNYYLDTMTDAERSAYWQDYYNGAEHVSGYGVQGADGTFKPQPRKAINFDYENGALSVSTHEQKAAYWQEYYGVDATHMSGQGVFNIDGKVYQNKSYGYYSDIAVADSIKRFELEYPGHSVEDVLTDKAFQSELVEQYTKNPNSNTAVLGKWSPTDGSFSYTSLANDPNFNSTYFEYGDRAAALEGVLGNDEVYDKLNRPYLEELVADVRNGKKQIILTTGPYSPDWATGFYGKELANISDILGLDGVDDLATHLKEVVVTVDGVQGIVYEIDFSSLKYINE